MKSFRKYPRRLISYLGAIVVAIIIIAAGQFFIESSNHTNKKPVPNIGGPFTLVNHLGKSVTEADFSNGFMLVYFGYTFCPDVCPIALSLMDDAMKLLGDDAKKVTPVFITIDPERDKPQDLKEYISHFNPRMVGLTGTQKQITAVADAYNVYSAKMQVEGSADGDYAMDHSSIIYFIGPDSKYRTHFGKGITPKTMAKQMRQFL